MIARFVVGIIGLVVLGACSAEQPSVEQQLQDDGYTLEHDVPPEKGNAIHVQFWERGEHLMVDIIKVNAEAKFEVTGVSDLQLQSNDRYAFSCSATHPTDVSQSVDDFENAKRRYEAGAPTVSVEGDIILNVQVPPYRCFLSPHLK